VYEGSSLDQLEEETDMEPGNQGPQKKPRWNKVTRFTQEAEMEPGKGLQNKPKWNQVTRYTEQAEM